MLHPLLTSFPLPIHAPSLPSLCLLTHQTPTRLKIMKLSSFSTLWLFFFIYHSTFHNSCKGDQSYYLKKFLKFQSYSSPQSTSDIFENFSPIYTKHQDGSMATDRIDTLPGQPAGVDFVQYAGYITVDPKAERALFYYFVESPQDSASKPLLLWLNGGPGCSSLGYGAMAELGPFRVKSDGKTLIRNDYAWNKVANVLFVESPAGVGFSYSNTSTNNAGDQRTVLESHVFLLNWLKRFPQYKHRDLFITGESYAGHYVPQLAEAILTMNRKSHTRIKLKGIAIGNPVIDHETYFKGIYDYLWSYSLISDETYAAIKKYCDFLPNGSRPRTERCNFYLAAATEESGGLDVANIYGSHCNLSSGQSTCVTGYDPCIDDYVHTYLNLADVQTAFHTKATNWTSCRLFLWTDSPSTVLPIIAKLITSGIRLWIYSGDTDAVVPITSTRYAINKLNLRINSTWRPWNSGKEVGGYVVGYEGLTFVTVKGAGHKVPMIQPERALIMISSFLEGKLPPSSH